mgnify:CR=1 FL=1
MDSPLNQLSVTLIIPCRNEEKNVTGLIDCLAELTYSNLEIILVDDQSEDNTYDLISTRISGKDNFHLISNEGSGKKKAILSAIKKATGEIIMTTDADCKIHQSWVEEMVSGFSNPAIQLVAGPVLPEFDSDKFSFELIEWGSILLTTQVSFAQGSPFMCSAANLVYRKKAFEEVGGYEGNLDEPSGDDEFLLKKIIALFGSDSVRYQISDHNLVRTQPQTSFESLISQRSRWAGKWNQNNEFIHRLAAVSSALLQLIWVASIVLTVTGVFTLPELAIIWTTKALAEFLSLNRVLYSFDLKKPIWHFVLTSLIHPIFVLFVVSKSFTGKIKWKGREINRNPNFV